MRRAAKGQLTKHEIPIYYVPLWIGVFPSKVFAQKAKEAHIALFDLRLDEQDTESECLLCYHKCKFLLLFRIEKFGIEKVAHEVFHLTHRLMEGVGCNFDPSHHEQGAYLHGWLMELVFKQTRDFLPSGP